MDTEADAFAYVITVLNNLAIPYLVGGGWAISVWGTPRLTHDVDLVVDLPLAQIPAFCAQFPADQYYIDPAAMRDQFRQPASPSLGMYSFYHHLSGLKIDLFPLRHTDAIQVAEFSRRVLMPILPGQTAVVCTAQDLLVQKLRWYQLGGRRSERQFEDCLHLVLTDLARADPQIAWPAVDRITQTLSSAVQEVWQAVKRDARAALQPPE